MVITVDALTKKYGELRAVDNISFNVKAGEIFAFLGPNGAGKTTTIEILQCLRRPTSGKVEVLGYDATDARDAREIKRRIGVLPQDFNALDKLTVRENISMFAAMYNKSQDPDDLIKLLDLEDKSKTRFDKLSGGLQQRVGIAASLVNDPEIVFLDEPTTGLDPKSRRDVWQVIQRLKREERTVFLTTHYMEEAERLADRIAVIHKGRIAADGTTNELLDKYGGDRVLLLEDVQKAEFELIRKELPTAHHVNGTVTIAVGNMKEIANAINHLNRIGVSKGVQIRNPTIDNVFLHLIGVRLTEEGELE